MRPWHVVLMSALVGSTAQATECEEPYTIDGLLTDLALTEGAMRSGDNASASESATRMHGSLECSEDILPGQMMARIYRAIGAGIFVGGDPDGGLQWLRTAAELEPDYEYAEGDLPADHPARSGLKLAKVEVMGTESEPMPDAGPLGPGQHFLDGFPIEEATAAVDRKHVYQLLIEAPQTFTIDGNGFPEEAFGVIQEPEPEPEPEPEVVTPEIDGPQLVKQRAWPAERVVLIGAGAAGVVASGALYGMSASTRSKFDGANTVADMDKFQKSTNTLVLASGASGAAGVGMLGFGVLFFIVDGDPRPTLDIRF